MGKRKTSGSDCQYIQKGTYRAEFDITTCDRLRLNFKTDFYQDITALKERVRPFLEECFEWKNIADNTDVDINMIITDGDGKYVDSDEFEFNYCNGNLSAVNHCLRGKAGCSMEIQREIRGELVVIKLTNEEMEQAYQEVELSYRKADAGNHIAEYCKQNKIPDISSDNEIVLQCIKKFDHDFDCNIDENTQWDNAIGIIIAGKNS